MTKTRLGQAGDTIVEVLLAVVVVGLAIGFGYGIASRSLKNNQRAQERVEALKQVESQVERLKKLAANSSATANIFTRSDAFCMTDSDSGPVDTSVDNDACQQGPDGRYRLSITPAPGNSSSTRQYDITATWDSLGGGEEHTTVTYRVYPGVTQ